MKLDSRRTVVRLELTRFMFMETSSMQRTSHRSLTVMGVALVFGLLTAPEAPAQSQKKIIVLGGGNSAVSSGVAKSRSRLDAKAMMRSARERKEKLKTANWKAP
jgi:hypothetical protein